MKSSSIILLLFLGSIAAKIAQTAASVSNVNKSTQAGDGKIVIHQDCNAGPSNEEVSKLKKEVEILRKELIHRLENIQKHGGTKGPWTKLNTAPVCFRAKGDQFGKFFVPSGGKLLAIKLVHVHGYVTCDNKKVYHWSCWGCGSHSRVRGLISVAITTSANGIILPPTQFIAYNGGKWFKIPGYNSLSPELVLSVFSSPLTVTSGQELRLWYGEDLVNYGESDNGGKSCCEVFASFM